MVTWRGRHQRRSPWRQRALALVSLATLLAVLSTFIAFVAVTPGEASTLTSSDGYTTLSTIGTVTAGTPYTSGQAITVSGIANPVLSNANLVANDVPGQTTGNPTGNFSVEECTDPGGLVANLPTSASGCEKATEDVSVSKTNDGSFTDTGYQVYDLPDTNLGLPTMTGTCDVAPNQCVIGIFATDPQSGNGFKYPHLFSAPFNIVVGDGLDLGDNPGDGSAPTIAQTSAANSTVVASPATAVADGVDTATVTVTMKDINKNPVGSGKSVTLSQGSGHSTIDVNGTAGSTAVTDSNGQAVFTVSDTAAEQVTYTATDTTDSVTVSDTGSVTFTAPTASAANSSIAAASSAVPQSGSTTVTVTLKDQGTPSEPITGKLITLSQGNGHSTIAPASTGSATTNAQGQASFMVSDTSAETVTYSAADTTDGIPLTGQTVSVTFGNLVVSPSQSTVTTATPIVATATSSVSQTSGTVDVTLLDGASAVSGKTVELMSSSSSTAVITPSSQTTGSNGVAAFTVSDPTAETVTFKAVDTSDSNLALTATTQVNFEVPAVSASTSGMSASPVRVPADGVSAASLTVTIEDQFGNPLAGKTVTIAEVVTGTSNPSATGRVVPAQGSGGVEITTTNGSGEITFVANDTTAESVTYTATDTTDNVTVNQTQTVTFLAGVPQVSQSTVQANPTSVPADGKSASMVTVTLADHNQNPVPGITVTLTALNGSSVIAPASGVATNSAGQATFKVTDTTSEVVRYRAVDTTDDLPLVGEEVQVTFGTPPPTAPALADCDIVAGSTLVPADGHSSATVEVILNDANGLPLVGKTVSLLPTSVSAVVSPATAVTDATGTATFTVTDKKSESVTLTATDITDNTPLTGLSVTISFTPATVATSSAGTSGGSSLNRPVVGMAAIPDGHGYWLVASDGGIFNYGDAGFYGSTGGIHLNAPVVGMAATPDGKGYWLVASDGGIFNYGDAAFYGSTGSIHLNRPIVGMAATPDGKGYWLVASDGGVFNYGDAAFYGSTGGMPLNKPVVGMAATPDGKGYWLAASDGGIFNYGDAAFYGSTGSIHLNRPVVGMAATPDGKGYWLVASDGGIFNYGDAGFDGSTGGIHLNQPVVGMAATPDGKGYWLAASDGGIFNYGDTAFYGSMVG